MTDLVLQFLITGIVNGLIYGLAAVAYTTIYNVTGVINFAQGDLVVLPTLSGIALYQMGLGYAGSVSVAIVIGGLLGALLDWGVVARLRGSVLRTTIATIGVGVILEGVAILVFGTDAQTLNGPFDIDKLTLGGLSIPGASVAAFVVTLALVAVLALLFQGSYIGRAFRACSLNPFAARLSGSTSRPCGGWHSCSAV